MEDVVGEVAKVTVSYQYEARIKVSGYLVIFH